jgi:hypothetical protein
LFLFLVFFSFLFSFVTQQPIGIKAVPEVDPSGLYQDLLAWFPSQRAIQLSYTKRKASTRSSIWIIHSFIHSFIHRFSKISWLRIRISSNILHYSPFYFLLFHPNYFSVFIYLFILGRKCQPFLFISIDSFWGFHGWELEYSRIFLKHFPSSSSFTRFFFSNIYLFWLKMSTFWFISINSFWKFHGQDFEYSWIFQLILSFSFPSPKNSFLIFNFLFGKF